MKDLIKQLELWNEQDEYQKIIDTIEALPEQEQTPQLISDLARAYNNLASPEDKHMFQRAVRLLLSVEEECSGGHTWNFRLGYAYLYLDQENKALPYFEKALEYLPGDEDTQSMIEMCENGLTLPIGLVSFYERTQKGWQSFLAEESKLRRMMDEKADSEELMAFCDRLLSPAFADVQFELGFNGEKHELILTPEGDRVALFKLLYFKNHAPTALLDKWNIIVGRQPSRGFSLRMHDRDISAEDVLVWSEVLENREVGISLYCEKLQSLQEENENAAYSMMCVLLDQVIGEVAAISYIGYLDLLDKPQAGESIVLEKLPEYIASEVDPQGQDSCATADQLCERYTVYEHKPTEEDDWYLREDVFAGSTCCPRLINEYYSGEEDAVDLLHQDGVAAGFFYYSLENVQRDEILNLRDHLEQKILEKAGADAILFTGGATGTNYGYLDFIAWNLRPVMDAASSVFEASDITDAGFHSFRRQVSGISLVYADNDA